jgi:hypothetical protein
VYRTSGPLDGHVLDTTWVKGSLVDSLRNHFERCRVVVSFAFGEELRFGGLMIGRLIRGRRSLDGVLGVI